MGIPQSIGKTNTIPNIFIYDEPFLVSVLMNLKSIAVNLGNTVIITGVYSVLYSLPVSSL